MKMIFYLIMLIIIKKENINKKNSDEKFQMNGNNISKESIKDNLKTDIDTYTQNNYNAIITMKDQEIEKWKNEEKLRKEREDQELKALISAYDTSLSMGERENAELKKRLKELEGYF